MSPVAIFLLSIASIFLIGTLGEIVFQKTNVPDVIWLIIAGILLGPVFGIVTRPQLHTIAPYFAALTLVVVLFEGGSALRLGDLSKAAPRSSLLAITGFAFASIGIAMASMAAAWVGILPDSWTWQHGFMLGAILGGSSSIIIMPAMTQARVASRLGNLIGLESALTDAMCVVGTSALVDVMMHGSAGKAAPFVALLKSFGIGLAIGLVAGLVWILFLRFLKSNEHAYPITLSVLLLLYLVIDQAGGSAAMGILTLAVVLGNAKSISLKIGLKEPVELDTSLRGFHKQMAFIVKSFFFVFIGAMLGPPWLLIVTGVGLGVVLIATRVAAVYLATLGSDLTPPERNLAVVSMPRGMAAGVLATLPVSAGIEGTESLPVIVFACVLTSILIFAAGFPFAKRGVPTQSDMPPSRDGSIRPQPELAQAAARWQPMWTPAHGVPHAYQAAPPIPPGAAVAPPPPAAPSFDRGAPRTEPMAPAARTATYASPMHANQRTGEGDPNGGQGSPGS